VGAKREAVLNFMKKALVWARGLGVTVNVTDLAHLQNFTVVRI